MELAKIRLPFIVPVFSIKSQLLNGITCEIYIVVPQAGSINMQCAGRNSFTPVSKVQQSMRHLSRKAS